MRRRIQPPREVAGKIKDVDDYTGLGFELAGQFGDFQFQGEYMTVDVARFGGRVDASFDGYLVLLTKASGFRGAIGSAASNRGRPPAESP